MKARTYTPRRSGARWREEAPAYVLDVFDNKGKTADRYTVVVGGDHLVWRKGMPLTYANCTVPYLGMSGSPTHPQGFSQWGEMSAHQLAMYRHRTGRQRIRWLDLPEHIRQHVIARCTPQANE